MSNPKTCATCKYDQLSLSEEPCATCFADVGPEVRANFYCETEGWPRRKWEPGTQQLTEEEMLFFRPQAFGEIGDPPKAILPETILQEAQRLVHGDRGADYGHPLDDFTKTATMFNALTGTNLTAEDVAVFMMCVKLSREANRHKRDNLTDLCGYAETLMMVRDERMRREELTTTFGPLGEAAA